MLTNYVDVPLTAVWTEVASINLMFAGTGRGGGNVRELGENIQKNFYGFKNTNVQMQYSVYLYIGFQGRF